MAAYARGKVVVASPDNLGLGRFFLTILIEPIANVLSVDDRYALGALIFVMDEVMADLGAIVDAPLAPFFVRSTTKARRVQNVQLEQLPFNLDAVHVGRQFVQGLTAELNQPGADFEFDAAEGPFASG